MPLQELTRELVEAIASKYPTLQTLTLARNTLRELRFLELLPPLRRLDLSDNQLQRLPSEIAQWGGELVFLDLTNNQLESLQQLRLCQSLETLRVGGNRIALFSELKHLEPLAHLRELTLEVGDWYTGNPIASPPTYRREVVSMLPHLQSLDGIDISQAERLFETLQQKPRLTVATTNAATSPAANSEASSNAYHRGGQASEYDRVCVAFESPHARGSPSELDLSRASHSWSMEPLAALSSAASSPSVASSARPSPRPQLLTPDQLRSTAAATPHSSQRGCSSMDRRRDGEDSHQFADSSHPAMATNKQHRPARRQVSTLTKTEPAHLLESRVVALESILEVQDKMLQDELVQVGKAQGHATATATTNTIDRAAQMYVRLLATWRQKVVALMVQIKTLELQKPSQSMGQQLVASDEQQRQRRQQEEVWKQKLVDALAQRDLERVRVEQSQRQWNAAEAKVVEVVRTLTLERDRVQGVAEAVALFAAKDGLMTSQMDVVARGAHRLLALETRLKLMSERLQAASGLVAHREARLRNSEAAMEAERRIWSHKMKNKVSTTTEEPPPPSSAKRTQEKKKMRVMALLRPATEQALRLLFHRLDPYHTGLISTKRLVDALRGLRGQGDPLGSDKFVDAVERGLRDRSFMGGLGGNITWGELLLVFMPVATTTAEQPDGVDGADAEGALMLPRFEELVSIEDRSQATVKMEEKAVVRADKQALQALTKHELIAQVVWLRGEREQMQRRVAQDATHLQRRAQWIASQWQAKADELISSNEELHQQLKKHTLHTCDVEKRLQDAERNAGEAQHQLQSLRRQLSEQATQFTSQKSDLEKQRVASVEKEQQVWQRELQDMAFQQSQLQAENTKLELSVRQLEREIARQKTEKQTLESTRVAHLEDKVRKRDDELAKLRRERNGILNALRDHERKLAQQKAEANARILVEMATQTTPWIKDTDSEETNTSRVQVDKNRVQVVQQERNVVDRTNAPRQLDQEQQHSLPPRQDAANVATAARLVPATRSTVSSQTEPSELHKRLQHLESLTESLLAD